MALVQLLLPSGWSLEDLLNDAVAIDARTSTYGLRRTAPTERLALHVLEGLARQHALDAGYAIIEAEKTREDNPWAGLR